MKKTSLFFFLWCLIAGFFSSAVNAQTVDATGTFDIPVAGDTLLYATMSVTDVNENSSTDVAFTLSKVPIGAWSDYAVAVRWAGSRIDVRDGGGFAIPLNDVAIEFDTKYHVWIAVNAASKTYTVWVKTDAMANPVLINQDVSFRASADTIKRWSAIHNPSGEPDHLNVDFVKSIPENYAMNMPGGSDGANSNVAIPALNLSALPVTIEMWFKPDPTQNNYSTLWYNRDGSNAGFQYDRWNDQTKVKAVWNGAAELPDYAPVPGAWNHMALVITSTSKTFYVNGIPTQEAGSSFSIYAMDQTTYLGWDNAGTDRTLKGLIDEFRVWSVEKDSATLADDKYSVLAGNETGLVGYWSFNDLAATATDLTASGNDGTISGATYIPSFDVSDPTLASIGLSVGALDKPLHPDSTDITATVPYATTSVDVTATPNQQGADVAGTGTVDVSSGSGVASLVVTALDGTTTRTYTLTINVEAVSRDATLSSITCDIGAVDPLMDPEVTSYDVVFPIGTTSVTVSATTTSPFASLTGDGAVDVSSGSVTDSIVVTAQDGTTTKTYYINFAEADGNNWAISLPGGSDGAGSNVAIPALNLSALPVTIEMWYRPDPIQNNYATLWYNRDGNNAGFQYDRWNDQTKVKAVWNGAAELPDDAPVPGAWNHMAVVITATSKTFYVNGVPTQETGSSFSIYAMDQTTYLGWDNAGADRTLKGLIDEFRVWSVEKDSATLADDKYSALTGDETGLVGYWNFDLVNSVQAVDLSGGGLHGLISGGTYVPSFDINDSTLSALSVDVAALDPLFDPAVFSYDVIFPVGTTSITVSAAKNNAYATLSGDGAVVDVSSGSATQDVVVTAPNGTSVGTYTINFSVADGKNYAMSLPGENGSTSNVDISGVGLNTLPYTIEMWIKPDGGQENNTGLFFNRPGNIGVAYASSWQGSGRLRFLTSEGGDVYGSPALTPAVTPDEWHHVAAVLTDSTRTLYLDGRPYTEKVAGGTFTADDYSSGLTYLGWDSEVAARSFKGRIEEVRAWSVAKDSATLVDDKLTVLNGDEADLVGYWNFDLPNSVKAIDMTGNGAHGTITGGTYVEFKLEVNLSEKEMILVEKDYQPFPLQVRSNMISDTVTLAASSGFSVSPDEVLPADLFNGVTVEVDATTAGVDDMGELYVAYVKDGVSHPLDSVDIKVIKPYLRYYIHQIPSGLVLGSRASDVTIPVLTDLVAGDSSQMWSLRPIDPDNDSVFNILEDAGYRYFSKQASSGWNTILGPLEQGDWRIVEEAGDTIRFQNMSNNLYLASDAVTADSRLYADKAADHANGRFYLTRATALDDASLSALSVDLGTLDPAFNPEVLSYTLDLPFGTTSVTVSATANDAPYATLTGDGAVDVSSGSVTADVVVTADDGVTTMTYSIDITVNPGSDDADLKSLSVSPGILDPTFAPGTTTYTVTAPIGTQTVTITAEANDANASVSGTGDVDVSTGSDTATVTVTAQNGTTTKDYTLYITVLVDGISSVNASGVEVFPTLAHGSFTVLFSGEPGTITVYDISGRVLLKRTATASEELIQISDEGVLFVHVESEGISQMIRVFNLK